MKPLYRIWVQPVIEQGEPIPMSLNVTTLEEARDELTACCQLLEPFGVFESY